MMVELCIVVTLKWEGASTSRFCDTNASHICSVRFRGENQMSSVRFNYTLVFEIIKTHHCCQGVYFRKTSEGRTRKL